MTASATPWGVVLFPIIFLLLLRWRKEHGTVLEQSRVSIIRRVVAFYIDLFVAMMAVAPIAAIPILIAEYLATGAWRWSFERDYARSTDWILPVSILIGFVCIFYYFKWHFDKQRQTVGQHLMNFKLVPIRDRPSIGIRFFVAWVCMAWWPFWPWTIFQMKQDYFWDTTSGIKARRVSF